MKIIENYNTYKRKDFIDSKQEFIKYISNLIN